MGPSFREILKLDCKVEEGGGTFGDDESEELDDLVGLEQHRRCRN